MRWILRFLWLPAHYRLLSVMHCSGPSATAPQTAGAERSSSVRKSPEPSSPEQARIQ